MNKHDKEVIQRIAKERGVPEYVVEEIIEKAMIFIKVAAESGNFWSIPIPEIGHFELTPRIRCLQYCTGMDILSYMTKKIRVIFDHSSGKPRQSFVRVYHNGEFTKVSLKDITDGKRAVFDKSKRYYEDMTKEEALEKLHGVLPIQYYIPGKHIVNGLDLVDIIQVKWRSKKSFDLSLLKQYGLLTKSRGKRQQKET